MCSPDNQSGFKQAHQYQCSKNIFIHRKKAVNILYFYRKIILNMAKYIIYQYENWTDFSWQNAVVGAALGEMETGSAGKQPVSDNLTDWNGHGGQKSPLNPLPIPRNYGLENPSLNL